MVRDNRSSAFYEEYLLNAPREFNLINLFFLILDYLIFLACWIRRVGQNDIIIVWNAIPSFLFGEKWML